MRMGTRLFARGDGKGVEGFSLGWGETGARDIDPFQDEAVDGVVLGAAGKFDAVGAGRRKDAEHLTPTPARYQIDPVIFARTLTTMLAHLVAGEKLPVSAREIVPDFIKGASVAPPAR